MNIPPIAMILAPAAMLAAPAAAQELALSPVADARLRYEHVDSASFPRDAAAVTMRVRSGLQASLGDFAVLGETESTLAIVDRYNNGLVKDRTRPSVLDAQTVDLNRLQLQYRGVPKTVVTAGRQRIAIEDERFVGTSPWRQNEATFDAVRVEAAPIPGVAVDLSYAWKYQTPFTDESTLPLPGTVKGKVIAARGAVTTPVGVVSALALLISPDDLRYLGGLAKTQTYAATLAGKRSLGGTITATYHLVYARQQDWQDDPVRRTADYLAAEAKLGWHSTAAIAGYEVRGVGNRTPNTGFQTLLASNNGFVGFADIFASTPADGVRQAYAELGHHWAKPGPFDALDARLIHRRFTSDVDNHLYGTEWDMTAVARFGRYALLARYADYRARSYAADTRKLWLSAEWHY